MFTSCSYIRRISLLLLLFRLRWYSRWFSSFILYWCFRIWFFYSTTLILITWIKIFLWRLNLITLRNSSQLIFSFSFIFMIRWLTYGCVLYFSYYSIYLFLIKIIISITLAIILLDFLMKLGTLSVDDEYFISI